MGATPLSDERREAQRSDVKVWLLGAVALNQFLASVDLPSSLTAAAVVGFVANQNVSAPHVHEDKRRVA